MVYDFYLKHLKGFRTDVKNYFLRVFDLHFRTKQYFSFLLIAYLSPRHYIFLLSRSILLFQVLLMSNPPLWKTFINAVTPQELIDFILTSLIKLDLLL